MIRQQLKRLAGLDREVTVEALPGDEDSAPLGSQRLGLGWRTRVQFAVRSDGVAGLRAHRSHEVVDVGECLIAHPAITDLGLPALRWPATASVEAVVATGSGERAVIITPGSAGPGGRLPGARRYRGGSTPQAPPGLQEPPGPPALVGVLDPSGPPDPPGADSVLRRVGHRLTPVRGRTYLSQRAAGRDWRVSAGVFWQVHPGAADVLTHALMTALEPRPGDVALDLYCGAGLFAGALAPAVGPSGTVIGVEADNAAVRDARHNLREWPWARVHKADVAAMLRRGGQRGTEGRALPAARLVVADPPRAGLAREVVDYLSAAEHGATRFAYVSCDPATLARDIGLLVARGWVLADLRAFDAFPMTHHVECVATLVTGPAQAPSSG